MILIPAVAVVAFAINKFPVGVVSLGVMRSLWATDIVSLDDAFTGFGSPTVFLIASLFVVAILTAVITTNGSVAAIYPLVVVFAVRFGYAPSKLFMPTAFAAHAEALLVLTGTPVTLLVADTASHEGFRTIGFFEVALAGLPLLIGTILVLLLLGEKLLPDRQPQSLVQDLAKVPDTLHGHYLGSNEFLRFTIPENSLFVGQVASDLRGGESNNFAIVSVKDGKYQLRTTVAS